MLSVFSVEVIIMIISRSSLIKLLKMNIQESNVYQKHNGNVKQLYSAQVRECQAG